MVGAAGFELATLCSQSRCATRLRYAPTANILTLKQPILDSGDKKVAPEMHLSGFLLPTLSPRGWVSLYGLGRTWRESEQEDQLPRVMGI